MIKCLDITFFFENLHHITAKYFDVLLSNANHKTVQLKYQLILTPIKTLSNNADYIAIKLQVPAVC